MSLLCQGDFDAANEFCKRECPSLQKLCCQVIAKLTFTPDCVWRLARDAQMLEYCRARVKTFAWESKVKEAAKK